MSALRFAPLLGLLSALPAQAPPEQQLDNGLRVVLVDRPELPLVTFALYLRGGLLADGPSTFRHASLAMGCMWMGCESPTLGTLDEEAVRAALADIGGESSSAVDLQDTRVQLSCLAPHAAHGLELLTAALFSPTYPDAVVAREVAQERNLLARRSKQPEFLAQRALLQALCGEHPLSDAFALEDRHGALAKLDRAALRAEHRRLVRPRLGTLFVVGPLTAALRDAVQRRFASWPDHGDPPPPEPRPITATVGHRVIEVPRPEMTQIYVQMATLGPAPADPQFATTHLFRMALSGGFTSRMQDELRVNRGLVYGITFSQPSLSIAAPTSITTSTRPDKVVELLDVTAGILRQTLAGDLPAPMLEAGRNLWLANRAIERESHIGFTDAMHRGLRLFGGLDGYAREIEAVRTATVADVLAAGQRFAPENFIVVLVGAPEELAKIDWRLKGQ